MAGLLFRKHRLAPASLLAFAALLGTALASQSLTPAEARNHISETATVCGKVASTHYAPRSHGQPTFINLDKPYPNSPFTVVIWGFDREKFGTPETGQAATSGLRGRSSTTGTRLRLSPVTRSKSRFKAPKVNEFDFHDLR